MPLTSSSPEINRYDSFDSFVTAVNQHAGLEGYAVVIARIKVSKKGEKRKEGLLGHWNLLLNESLRHLNTDVNLDEEILDKKLNE